MAINLNMTSQRHKTAALIKKAPQRLVSDNSLHIYYGDSWLPLISPIRAIAFPGALAPLSQTHTLAATTRPSSVVTTYADTPNFSRPRKTTLTTVATVAATKHFPNVFQKRRATASMNPTMTAASTRRNKTPQPDTIQIWDTSCADQEYGPGLLIPRLAGGMGIAVHGHYAERQRAGHHQARYDAFLAHLVEGRMEETMQILEGQVEEARKRGLQDLQLTICYRDDQTLNQDSGMIWNSRMIMAERQLNERFILRAEKNWGTPRLHPYHVCGERLGMVITSSSVADASSERVVSMVDF